MKNIILIVVAAAAIYHFWGKYKEDELFKSSHSPNGFVEVVMPNGTKNNMVYVLAPINCPKEAGQRADAIERELNLLGIPVERSSNGSLNSQGNSVEEQKKFKRSVAIMKGEIPGVFVNGMAKENPAISEVVAEYKRTEKL